MDNSSLSKEQRLRIEENKRRALAKRQQSLAAVRPTAQQTTTQNANNAARFLPAASSYSNNTAPKPSAAQHFQTSKIPPHPVTTKPQVTGSVTGSGNNFPRPSTSTSIAVPETGKRTVAAAHLNKRAGTWLNKGSRPFSSNQHSGLGKNQFFGQSPKPLKGQCILISKERFEVNIGFNQCVVEVFKTINSRVYGKCFFPLSI